MEQMCNFLMAAQNLDIDRYGDFIKFLGNSHRVQGRLELLAVGEFVTRKERTARGGNLNKVPGAVNNN